MKKLCLLIFAIFILFACADPATEKTEDNKGGENPTPPSEKIFYELTVKSDPNGTILPIGGLFVQKGVATKITADDTLKNNYAFDKWVVDKGKDVVIADVTNKETTITLNSENAVVRATFIEIVYIPDVNLKAVIRVAIPKPEGYILPSDAASVTELYAENKNISDLTGLEHFSNLNLLDLTSNAGITDLKPIKDLVKLEKLYIGSRTKKMNVSDLNPLVKLTNLKQLFLDNNKVVDISPLKGMILLESLDLEDNNISNIDAITSTDKDFTYLNLNGNSVTDISKITENHFKPKGTERRTFYVEYNGMDISAGNANRIAIEALDFEEIVVHWKNQ